MHLYLWSVLCTVTKYLIIFFSPHKTKIGQIHPFILWFQSTNETFCILKETWNVHWNSQSLFIGCCLMINRFLHRRTSFFSPSTWGQRFVRGSRKANPHCRQSFVQLTIFLRSRNMQTKNLIVHKSLVTSPICRTITKVSLLLIMNGFQLTANLLTTHHTAVNASWLMTVNWLKNVLYLLHQHVWNFASPFLHVHTWEMNSTNVLENHIHVCMHKCWILETTAHQPFT